jgi:hypothetical protein
MKPTPTRFTNLRKPGRTWKQPPVRIQFCIAPSEPGNAVCGNFYECMHETVQCPGCMYPWCTSHIAWHIQALSVPPQSWRTVCQSLYRQANAIAGQAAARLVLATPAGQRLTELRIAQKTLASRPPTRVWHCLVPDSKNVDRECVFPSTQCAGVHASCLQCRFSHCARHGQRHTKALARTVWESIKTQYIEQLDNPDRRYRNGGIHIHVPRLRGV